MRIYRLADTQKRKETDLQDYAELIEKIVTSIVPGAVVIVSESDYTILSDITKGQMIKIGRALAHSELGQFCISRPILFVGEEIEIEED